MKYTVAEFRKNMREAFEAAERGELVEIERYDQSFYLVEGDEIEGEEYPELLKHSEDMPKGSMRVEDTPQFNVLKERGPDILKTVEAKDKTPETPVKGEDPIDEWFESHSKGRENTPVESNDNGGFPCCELRTPCKHWAFDGTRQAWVNQRTGEIREVN